MMIRQCEPSRGCGADPGCQTGKDRIRALNTDRTMLSGTTLASSIVNPHASTYRELLNVPDMVAAGEDVEPPLARGMSDAEIMISEISSSTPEFPPTQSTERAVKVTTKASAVFLSGVERQDGAAINKRVYRDRYGGQVTKKRYLKERSE